MKIGTAIGEARARGPAPSRGPRRGPARAWEARAAPARRRKGKARGAAARLPRCEPRREGFDLVVLSSISPPSLDGLTGVFAVWAMAKLAGCRRHLVVGQ